MKEIYDLSLSCDVIFLQETWLLKSDLGLLGEINSDFYGQGISAVDCESDVLKGRPYGGLAVIWRKSLSQPKIIYHDSRMISFEMLCSGKKLLFNNVYLPFCSHDNIDDFMYHANKMDSIVQSSDTPYIFLLVILMLMFYLLHMYLVKNCMTYVNQTVCILLILSCVQAIRIPIIRFIRTGLLPPGWIMLFALIVLGIMYKMFG